MAGARVGRGIALRPRPARREPRCVPGGRRRSRHRARTSRAPQLPLRRQRRRAHRICACASLATPTSESNSSQSADRLRGGRRWTELRGALIASLRAACAGERAMMQRSGRPARSSAVPLRPCATCAAANQNRCRFAPASK
jgi:hypothetical protein